jgi:Tol biopolymer transport system component
MSSDRWRQVEDLCHAALAYHAEERRAFLANACQGDEGLRREVESLLAQESSAEGFMSVPAAALVGSADLDQPERTLIGARFGSYTIRSLLGVGGMGEVYRAHDETLGREVAIKVLSSAFTAEPERRARFEREARMLATLNHPHIGAIYGVEEADGVRALVLELVEGETLAERIAGPGRAPGNDARGLSVSESLTIARQIADALEAAHEKGIVHRDLKPANIKITPEGAVKVLDFGLAKVATPDSLGSEPSQSRAGAVFGTAAYMSPEQARGHNVDKRADIWAFGCVLFEMLTGRAAFAGDTASDTIAKILEREPDWSTLPSATPVAIRRLLFRCLTKDSKRRLRDVGDVRIEIDAINEVVPGTVDGTVPAAVSTRKTWLPWAVAAAFAVLAAGGIVWELRRPTAIENPLSTARMSRLTDWAGAEAQAEISSDGRFVAFLADREGHFDLWLSQVDTWKFTNLTQDRPPLDSPSAILRSFGFNGDGTEIWFSPREARGQNPSSVAPRTEAKMLMPLLGGTTRPFLGETFETPAWSPDGTRLAYFTNGNGDPLFVADRIGADGRQIFLDQPESHSHNPVWSPDGRWIYFVHGTDVNEKMDIWRIQPSGEAPERLTYQNAAVNFLAPLDARTLIYTARAEDGTGPALWTLDVPTRSTRRVSSDLERYTSVAASRDGRRIVATVANPSASLWRVSLDDPPIDDRDVQPYPVSAVRAQAVRFAGASLYYLATGGVGDSLWRLSEGQASEVVRGADMPLSEPAAVSPDGRRVVVVVRRGGLRRLVIMSADGTNMQTLAPSIDIQGAPGQAAADWSPDGSWIVAGGLDADGKPALFKIPASGGDPVRIVSGKAISGRAVNPVWSPDGSLIAYGDAVVAGQTPLKWVRPDGTAVDLPPLRVRQGGYRFLPDSKGLVFQPSGPSSDFWLLDLATKTTRQLTHLSDRGRIRTFDIMPDGKAIVFDRIRENSDIVVIDLPK